MMKLRNIPLLVVPFALGLFSVSCATPRAPSSGKTVTACPDCQVVTRLEYVFEGYQIIDTVERKRHDCPGCQGQIMTFLKEGKFEHRCSVCGKSPYTCNVAHAGKSS